MYICRTGTGLPSRSITLTSACPSRRIFKSSVSNTAAQTGMQIGAGKRNGGVENTTALEQEDIEKAVQLSEIGDFEQASILFSSYLKRSPDDAVALEMQAQVLQELGAYDDACKAACKAAQLLPDWTDAHVTYARCCLNCGFLRESLQAFSTARMLDPAGTALAREAEEAASLYSEQVSQQIGLPLTLLCSPGTPGSHGGPGHVVWDCGVLLAWYINHHLGPKALRGVPVLELGSGCSGIAGLAAAQCGAHITLTDTRDVLPALAASVAANAEAVQVAGGTVEVASCDWDAVASGDLPRNVELPMGGWIIGADLVYSHRQVGPLIATLSAFTAACTPSPKVLIAHKHRSDGVDGAFMVAAATAGLHMTEVPLPQGGPWLADPRYKNIYLYALSNRAIAGALDGPQVESDLKQQQQQKQPRAPHSTLTAQPAAAEDLLPLQTPLLAHKSVAVIGFGIPGVGKSTVLQALHGALSNSIIIDKDVINTALLGPEHAMFSDYYDKHVRIQSYQVLFQLAASQFQPGKELIAILDGQFGDKLNADYIQGGLESLPCPPLLVYFWCPSVVQFERMRARGATRDSDKYAQLEELRAGWLAEHEDQIAEWNASCAGRGRKQVVRMSTDQPVQQQVRQLLQFIAEW